MTFGNARILFDAMDTDHKDIVVRNFDLIRAVNCRQSVFDCFVEAVEHEAKMVEQEMLFEQETDGTA